LPVLQVPSIIRTRNLFIGYFEVRSKYVFDPGGGFIETVAGNFAAMIKNAYFFNDTFEYGLDPCVMIFVRVRQDKHIKLILILHKFRTTNNIAYFSVISRIAGFLCRGCTTIHEN